VLIIPSSWGSQLGGHLHAIIDLLRRIVFSPKSCLGFPPRLLVNLLADIFMADTCIIDLGTGDVLQKHGHGRPRGCKNKPKDASMVASSSSTPVKRRPGCPLGSKNKLKHSASLAGRSVDANTVRHSTPPPSVNVFSFFSIPGAQYREQQRVPLKFTAFMDGRELREAILREESGEGTPYEVEVYYDRNGEMYFRGSWPQFAEDHDLHQGFFMLFNYHCGTSKFDVKIFDGTQCQKKYEAEVHFH
jgi:hypothetical protein